MLRQPGFQDFKVSLLPVAFSRSQLSYPFQGVGILFATPDIIIQRVAYQLLE
jgi:hypothetical protein